VNSPTPYRTGTRRGWWFYYEDMKTQYSRTRTVDESCHGVTRLRLTHVCVHWTPCAHLWEKPCAAPSDATADSRAVMRTSFDHLAAPENYGHPL